MKRRNKNSLLAQAVWWAITAAALTLAGCKPTPSVSVVMVGKLEKPLADLIASSPSNRLISVVVRMEQQVTEADKRALFASLNGTNQVEQMEMQRTSLINRLRQLADVTQGPLLTHLQSLETNGIVRHVRSMWLANGIGMEAPPSVIVSLASSNGVESIHLDEPQAVIQGAGAMAIPWGLTQIGIDPAVAPTIKQTVVVAVLDTGVNYTNHDLANRFWANPAEDLNKNGKLDPLDNNSSDNDSNGYKDDVIGWDFHKPESNNVMDLHGHGTILAGIIAGDGTDGTRTGVIPQAKIMVLREGSDSSTPLVTQQECWQGMEYAVVHKAHIINFSSGWRKQNNPLYATWRNNVQNATDAGVLFVTVSGDTKETVQTPGTVATALTVGSSDKNDKASKWSCVGPVTWWGINPWSDYPAPPGLLKPDLVAPGEDIQSTGRESNYVNSLGTSMSAPYVAGVAALLRAQNTNLNPYEVRYILEETALLIGAAPNSTSGWGRLDAKKALALTLNDLPVYDMSVDSLDAHTMSTPTLAALKLNKPTLFFAKISNLGGQVVGNAEVRFYFKDAVERGPGHLGSSVGPEPPTANFEYIGSYFIPVLGPAGSKHASATAVVRWKVPKVKNDHWWLGIRVIRGPINKPEANIGNNIGVKQLD
jgi:subtilisin family serine protease